MGEAEGIVVEAAWLAVEGVQTLWRRRAADGDDRRPERALRRRLELVTGALCGVSLPVVLVSADASRSWLDELVRRLAGREREPSPAASTDGARIWLPFDGACEDAGRAWALLRLWAIEQAARVARDTPSTHAMATDSLSRALFELAEAIAVDRWIALELPGVVPELLAARREALAARPMLPVGEPARSVEALIRAALGAHPASCVDGVPNAPTALDSLEWARATASDLSRGGGHYRGVAAVQLWGRIRAATSMRAATLATGAPKPPQRRSATLARPPRVREVVEARDDEAPGAFLPRFDDPLEAAEDATDLRRPTDREEAETPQELAEALSELREARVEATADEVLEVLEGLRDEERRATGTRRAASPVRGIVYPEWDFRIDAYRTRGAIVHEQLGDQGDPAWLAASSARQARLVREVRRTFEALRARRNWRSRRADGPEIDLEACVAALCERATNHAVDDRIYAELPPQRREIAVAILADASGSTDAWLRAGRRIIDVEKDSLLVLAEALDALHARFAAYAFSGEGREHVWFGVLKRFDESYGMRARLRVAALAPDRSTRMGAAIRHATASFACEPARHRLLLVLSDGRPNDVDLYEGRYGIEDTRQAVFEARLQKFHVACITIDREAPSYLPRIFGPGAAFLLHRPHELPRVAARIVRRLLSG
jgi:nitric oxide reductase NorD protein